MNVATRMPPADLDAEAAVISACLIADEAIDDLEGKLLPEHFYSEAHRQIFAAMLWLAERGLPRDVVHLGSRLKDTGRIEQVGGMAYVIEVMNAAPAVDRVAKYGDIVRDKWRARKVIEIGHKAVAAGYASEPADAIIAQADGALFALGRADSDNAGLEHVLPVLRAVGKDILAQIESPNDAPGYRTGFARLDQMIGGLHEGDLTIVAARPGMGKTAFVLNIAANVVAKQKDGRPVDACIFSLEMPRKQLGLRMACSEARVDVSLARTGRIGTKAWAAFQEACTWLGGVGLYIDDDAMLSVPALRAKVRRRKILAERDGRRIGLVAVDYLQLMKGREGAPSREQEISEISRGLKQLAKELGVPVIALSQLNRAVETRVKNKRPQISDLRESGAIEQDADNIIFIYRDDYYEAASPEAKVAELIVAKQRNGPTGMVKVRFDREYTRFDNLAEEHDA